MKELTDLEICKRVAEIEGIEGKIMNLNAYHYGFETTGNKKIDAILASVAAAGKGAHHTEAWTEVYDWESDGKSAVDRIQIAANEAAETDETDRVLMLKLALTLCKEIFITNDLILDSTLAKIDEALAK